MENKTAGKFETGHIGLNVNDLERSKKFYQKVFNFDVLTEFLDHERSHVFLGRDDQIFLTLWQQSDNSFSPASAGLHHLSFEAESMEMLKHAEKILRELGAAFQYDGIVPHREGAGSGGIFFEDPDGIRLEIYTAEGVTDVEPPNADAPTCGFF